MGLLCQQGFHSDLLLIQGLELSSGRIQLGIQGAQQVEVALFIVGKHAEVQTLKRRQLGVLVVEVMFRLLEPLLDEAGRAFRGGLARVQVYLCEKRG